MLLYANNELSEKGNNKTTPLTITLIEVRNVRIHLIKEMIGLYNKTNSIQEKDIEKSIRK